MREPWKDFLKTWVPTALCWPHFPVWMVNSVFSISKNLGMIFRNYWIPKLWESWAPLKLLNSSPHHLFLKILAVDFNTNYWNLQHQPHDFTCPMRDCFLELVYDPFFASFSTCIQKNFWDFFFFFQLMRGNIPRTQLTDTSQLPV